MKKYNSFEELKTLPLSKRGDIDKMVRPDFKIWDFHRDTVSQDSKLN